MHWNHPYFVVFFIDSHTPPHPNPDPNARRDQHPKKIIHHFKNNNISRIKWPSEVIPKYSTREGFAEDHDSGY